MTTKVQWKAIHDYCDAIFYTPRDLIRELRENGTVDRSTKLEDLGDCVSKKDYDTMFAFLEAHVS